MFGSELTEVRAALMALHRNDKAEIYGVAVRRVGAAELYMVAGAAWALDLHLTAAWIARRWAVGMA